MSVSKKLKLGILVSGRGSNLQAIIDACEKNKIDAEVSVVISNNPGAFAMERAKKHNIPIEVVDAKNPEPEILQTLGKYRVDLVCLAGFMKILSPAFVKAYPAKIINIHPALLPAFPGLHAQKQALDAGVKMTGATVHFVDEGCDTGPIILQKSVPVLENDSLESLTQRILEAEHEIYPQAIQRIATGSLKF
ncbi:MAG: phosphoribosylglycinamide formyltransferase [Deltaproteobacteria bacterium]|nr:phosphoribosylglycinamide formyltransferase [Deltaproteobacteria bacterium]